VPRHRSTGTALLDHQPDHGHAFIRRNARVVPQARLGAAQGMELTDIPDIDHPDRRGASVRVARRIDPLIAILDVHRDGPGRSQWLAAEEFRRHNAIANGIRPMAWASFISTHPDGQTPAQILLDSQRKVRQAWLAIRGPENNAQVADVVRLVVLGQMTLQVVDMSRRCRHGTSRELLDVGLSRLTDHYGMA
jgi:hypothetical protein